MSDTGGPAYPFYRNWNTEVDGQPGMSLLDWFAGKALMGILAGGGVGNEEVTIHTAYGYAEGMLAEKHRREAT